MNLLHDPLRKSVITRSGAVESATTTPNHYLDAASSSCESSSYSNDCSGGGSGD